MNKKNQHIQVFIRVRPINTQEKEQRCHSIIDIPTEKEVTVRQLSNAKKFTFDRIFGPKSEQLDVYSSVVSPLINEVLTGYNCTVFAYGQTGTGKTYTMTGGSENSFAAGWQVDPQAGIIPRTLGHLFDDLRVLQVEHTVRVSYLELYNEELYDLLSPTTDLSSSKLRLYEDNQKKGSVIVHGLEEAIVHNKNEVYKILEKGSDKRRTATTLMNEQSSRSHTIFSITVHIKDTNVEGEDMVKIGKLNLVDLAGSENIGRSGSVDKRAREAGNINQSLLTLGRVITALVERAPHVPYRESKLTRILQDSLGGRTKTSIIATISPANCNLEETLSTLEYAHRAKNITNRPEINQKCTKSALLKQYTEEIERLRRDLVATRACNGVYLEQENYDQMVADLENYAQELAEKINDYRTVSEQLERTKQICDQLNMNLANTNTDLQLTKQRADEQEHLVEKLSHTEQVLSQQAKKLLETAKIASCDNYKLHDKLDVIKNVQNQNVLTSEQFQANFSTKLDAMKNKIKQFFYKDSNAVNEYLKKNAQMVVENRENLAAINTNINQLLNTIKESNKTMQSEIASNLKATTELNIENLEKIVQTIADNNYKRIQTFLATVVQKELENSIKSHDLILGLIQTKRDNFSEYINSNESRLAQLQALIANSNEKIRRYEQCNKELLKKNKNLIEQLLEEHRLIEDHSNQLCSESLSTNTDMEAILVETSQGQTAEESRTVQFLNDLTDKQELLKSSSETLIERIQTENAEFLQDVRADVQLKKDKFGEFSKQIDAIISKHTHISAATDKTVDDIVNENLKLVTASNDIGQFSDVWRTNSQRMSDMRIGFKQDMEELIDERGEDIKTLFTREITLTNQPTGLTPVRKEYQYPRYLAATSPKELILERYRRMKEQEEQNNDNDPESSLQTPPLSETIASEPECSKENKGVKISFRSFSEEKITNKENISALEITSKSEDNLTKAATPRNILGNSNRNTN